MRKGLVGYNDKQKTLLISNYVLLFIKGDGGSIVPC